MEIQLNDTSWLYKVNSAAPVKLIVKLLEYSGNNIELSTKLRQDLYNELELSRSTFTKALNTLLELGVISGERGSYTVNKQILQRIDD